MLISIILFVVQAETMPQRRPVSSPPLDITSSPDQKPFATL